MRRGPVAIARHQRRGAHQVGHQVVAGRGRALAGQLAYDGGEVGGRGDGGGDDRVGRCHLVHLDDRLRPRTQLRGELGGHSEELGDHEHGQRLGVLPDDVEADGVDPGEQPRGELAHPGPEPFDVAAVERRRHEPSQPRVLGWLVLHHLVPMQQVERLQVGRRLAVLPDPSEAPVAQYRAHRRVVEGEERAGLLVPRQRSAGPFLGEGRVRVGDQLGRRQVKRGRAHRVRTHPAAPRSSAAPRTRSRAAGRRHRSRTAAADTARTA